MQGNAIQAHLFGDEPDPANIPRTPKRKRGDPTQYREPLLGYKVCSDCKKALPSKEFRWNKATNGIWYRGCRCHRCRKINMRARGNTPEGKRKQRNANFLRMYGITYDEHAAMVVSQRGACAICGDTEMPLDKRTGKPYQLAVDHDHKTGKVRQLLCPACNNGLGCFKDEPQRLHAAIQYLKKHSELSGH